MTDLERVIAKMRDVIKPEAIERVLDTPAPVYDGLTRRQMIEQGRTEEVLTDLDRIASGDIFN